MVKVTPLAIFIITLQLSWLKKQNQLDEFYSALMQSHDKNEVEQRFVQITASQLSAIVLKQWKFDDDVVKIVFNENECLDF